MAFDAETYRPKNSKKRHRKRLQVLLVPDDQNEPRSFSVSYRTVTFLKWLGVFLCIHIIVGFYAYSSLNRQLNRVRSLEQVNQQLVENNQRINELSSAFKKLEQTDQKIRAALGLSSADHSSLSIESLDHSTPYVPERRRPDDKTALTLAPAVTQMNLTERLGILQQSTQNGLHSYLRNIPTYLPVEGVLTNDYSRADLNSASSNHQGIDIAAPRGSFVRAAGDGMVVFAGWTEDLGNLVIIHHGDGFFTYYGHNQRLLVQRNSLVHKAEEIALLGSSGDSSAPHVHFEIWKDGIPQDPKKYILAFSGM